MKFKTLEEELREAYKGDGVKEMDKTIKLYKEILNNYLESARKEEENLKILKKIRDEKWLLEYY